MHIIRRIHAPLLSLSMLSSTKEPHEWRQANVGIIGRRTHSPWQPRPGCCVAPAAATRATRAELVTAHDIPPPHTHTHTHNRTKPEHPHSSNIQAPAFRCKLHRPACPWWGRRQRHPYPHPRQRLYQVPTLPVKSTPPQPPQVACAHSPLVRTCWCSPSAPLRGPCRRPQHQAKLLGNHPHLLHHLGRASG